MSTTRERLKHTTQARVVEAAGRLFRERGFPSTTVRDIAEASGVSVGTVMAVGDKNGLLVRVFDEMVGAEHARRAGMGSTSAGSATCPERLVALVEPFVAIFMARPELAQSYASIVASGTQTSTLFTDLAGSLVGEFATTLAAHGCVDRADATALAESLYAAYVGTLFISSARGTDEISDLVGRIHAVFTSICRCKE